MAARGAVCRPACWNRWQQLSSPVAPSVALGRAQMLITNNGTILVGDGRRPAAALVSCAVISPFTAGVPDASTVAATVDPAHPASALALFRSYAAFFIQVMNRTPYPRSSPVYPQHDGPTP